MVNIYHRYFLPCRAFFMRSWSGIKMRLSGCFHQNKKTELFKKKNFKMSTNSRVVENVQEKYVDELDKLRDWNKKTSRFLFDRSDKKVFWCRWQRSISMEKRNTFMKCALQTAPKLLISSQKVFLSGYFEVILEL